MGTQATILTPQQMRCIYALSRKGGLDSEALHAVVGSETGKESIKELSGRDAWKVIERLKRMTGQEAASAPDRSTQAQAAKIHALAAKLGWADDPRRLTSFLEKRYGVSHPRYLTAKNTQNCLQAMKAMLAGGRGERKGAQDGKVDGEPDR